MPSLSLIESDRFPFEFLSALGERESWRKEVHRPVYYLHKWWAKRLGSVFRGILLGCRLGDDDDLESAFYRQHEFSGVSVFDPFMGSGTTIGEAHKLGFTALGRDINPVAVDAVSAALGPVSAVGIEAAYRTLSDEVGEQIRPLYRSCDADGMPVDVLYHFWVMTAPCPDCGTAVDLFSSFVFARNAYPTRKPDVRVICPKCGDVFAGVHGARTATCGRGHRFDPEAGPVRGAAATCPHCKAAFKVIDAVGGTRPAFRQYAKLVLAPDGQKRYLATTPEDEAAYAEATRRLGDHRTELPTLELSDGHNTRQAMRYGFRRWADFFNDRQLLALVMLRDGIERIPDAATRNALRTLFSGVLEFNNLFASYKGEGTGAVRHMFAHHILKPERTPIEANVWGTRKSSGSFTNLYRSRLLRLIQYRDAPTEVSLQGDAERRVCSPPFAGSLSPWSDRQPPRGIALSCGDSSRTGLSDRRIDLVVTDPPFFDNVHYSELADFFQAWRRIDGSQSTRAEGEVQDADADRFADKLAEVFRECSRVLKDDGLLVFSYHHSRAEGWSALAHALLNADLAVVNAHPVRAELSLATPKSQAKNPIQFDIILVCRKTGAVNHGTQADPAAACRSAEQKVARLERAGFALSGNDRRIVYHGQLLTTVRSKGDIPRLSTLVSDALACVRPAASPPQSWHLPVTKRNRRRRNDQQQLLLPTGE